MSVEYCVVSIGALSRNRLWGELSPIRTAHSTTTLVSTEDRMILVDPSLPGRVLEARFNERTGKHLSDVTDVFCTTLRPVHSRGADALPHAKWWCIEEELETYREYLLSVLGSADRLGTGDASGIEAELKRIERFSPAPVEFAKQVQVYPMHGASAGSAGLLLTPTITTIVIAGDTALTAEHVNLGQIWKGCANTEQALQSLQDLLELADIIVPGHDNVMVSPQRGWV